MCDDKVITYKAGSFDQEKKCSNCYHSAFKQKYINTFPSLHTCMNEKSDTYLKDRAWSCVCDLWKSVPKSFAEEYKDLKIVNVRDLTVTFVEEKSNNESI